MYWMAIGPVENWKLSLEGNKVWGMQPRYQKQWEQIELGDSVLFYATTPVKGVIGYGTINSKMQNDKLIWPQEVEQGRTLWPLRFIFEIVFCLSLNEWETKRARVSHQVAVLQKSFQKINEEVACSLIEAIQTNP